jgi:TPR repeat protein
VAMRTLWLVAALLTVAAPASRVAAQPASPATTNTEDAAVDTPVSGDAGISFGVTRCASGVAAKCREAAAEMERLHVASRYGYSPSTLRARADALLEERCTAGDGAACFEQGKYLERGHGHARDASAGRDRIEHACELKYGDACAYLGDHAKPTKQALALYERACAADSAHGCEQLAMRLGDRDRDRIAELHHKACAGDDLAGCEQSGALLRARGDRSGALADFERACELELAHGLHDQEVASCDAAGVLATDATHARELFERACEAGHALGCEHLGERIARGEGGERNWGAGLELVADGCERAHDTRCRALVDLKKHPPDWQCATADECQRHCDEHLWPACRRMLELAYAASPGEEFDFELLEQACTGGDATGCRMRGDRSTVFGDALPWYQRGCKLRDAGSCGYTRFARALHSAGQAKGLRVACAKDHAACALYGIAIAKRDPKQAAKVWRDACDAKVGVACRFLARTFVPTNPWRDDVMADVVLGTTPLAGATCDCDSWGGATTYTPQQEEDASRRRAESARLLRLGCAAGDVRSCEAAVDADGAEVSPSIPVPLPAWE